jgi:hypothetical protein
VIHTTVKIEIKGDKYVAEVLSTISATPFQADEWRSQGRKFGSRDVNGNKLDEATLSKSDDQIR